MQATDLLATDLPATNLKATDLQATDLPATILQASDDLTASDSLCCLPSWRWVRGCETTGTGASSHQSAEIDR